MKILVNTRFLLQGKLEGIGWFTYETLKRICRDHPEHEFIFAFDRPYSEDFIFSENIIPEVAFPPARHPILWYWWFEWSIPRLIKKYDADLFLSTDGFTSLRAKIKNVLVIHDLAFEHYPQYVPNIYRQFYKTFSPKYAQRAERIATVSQYSKNDIINSYKIADEKIDVVYNGVNDRYSPLTQDEKQKARQQYAQGNPYFAYIGSLHPRKNILTLLKAFETFKQTDSGNVKLLLTGRLAWSNKEMMEFYDSMEFKDDVIFIGHANVEEIRLILGGSLALVYVSLFEGFGIPLIEAMQCETAIITSNVTSLPEVAGDAAVLVNPESVNEVASAMKKILENTELRNSLIEKGKVRREQFSWDKTAHSLWNCIEKTL